MSARISVESFSLVAAEDRLRRPSVVQAEVESVGPMVVKPKPATVTVPDWRGTLPGVMAGKRPAPRPMGWV